MVYSKVVDSSLINSFGSAKNAGPSAFISELANELAEFFHVDQEPDRIYITQVNFHCPNDWLLLSR